MTGFPARKTLIVVAGPTAVGKTAVSVSLAERFKTEIISADSRQFFREMNIGTAKPSPKDLSRIKHHFINSHSIREDYDAAQYGEDALKLIEDLFIRTNFVILCGGSGLYIKAVTDGFDDIPAIDPTIRKELKEGYSLNGIDWLKSKLQHLDPDHYAIIDQQNPHRLMRALEVKIGTGFSIASFRNNNKRKHPFRILKAGLEVPREQLYGAIDGRIDRMIETGLFEEAKLLYPFRSHNALQTVGYQEVFDFMDGLYDREEAVRLLKRNSRRYAKRQLTWFKRDPDMRWFHPDELNNIVNWIQRPE
jgi:tRNA dimethylallyltransferase